MRNAFAIVLALLAGVSVRAQTWTSLGPPGGDVRALAVDPQKRVRIFLGTTDGHIFGSEDSGAHWALLGRASSRADAVITAIVVDPRDENVLYASSWTRNSAAFGGGVYRSADGGETWSSAGLVGQAVRALAMSPSNPDELVAGTLEGVYRSLDAAKSWQRISPEHHEELRNLDSLAIDPRDPQIIYAGTFHLPWKTTDGGRTWRPVHEGMIDDSDVMSLLIDAGNFGRIYASACSGIYRSEDGAAQWKKIQGIPYAARRTYAIAQDPRRPASVYAATSEGLWKTEDAGMTWRRTTSESLVVNTVAVADGSPGRVLIGTEKLGVLASDDGGEHFLDANTGFEHRQILALGPDTQRPGRMLAVLANAPEPVLATEDGGRTWLALGPGLHGEETLRVYAAPDGDWWASLTRGGLLRYDNMKKIWARVGTVVGEASDGAAPFSQASSHLGAGHVVPLQPPQEARALSGKKRSGPQPLADVVSDVFFRSKDWYAATSRGLLVSTDGGATWTPRAAGPLSTLPLQSVVVSPDGERIRVVSLGGMVFSEDAGKSWAWHDLPLNSGGAVTLDDKPADENTLIATARSGLYISRDAGETWEQAASGLPSAPVQSFAVAGGIFVAALRTGGLYFSLDSGETWDRVPGVMADGFFEAIAPGSGFRGIFAASATDGLYKVEWPALTAGDAADSGRNRMEASHQLAAPDH
jgi:photosystem II stability/assembly factor-like uncharacterized protein